MERKCNGCDFTQKTIKSILLCDVYAEESPCVNSKKMESAAGYTQIQDGIRGKDCADASVGRSFKVVRHTTVTMTRK